MRQKSGNAFAMNKTSMNDHINRFEQLAYDINYNNPTNTINMEQSLVNLKFLNTLMSDKSRNGKRSSMQKVLNLNKYLRNSSTLKSELMQRMPNLPKPPSPSNEVRALTTTEFQQAIQALNTQIGFQCGNSNNGRGRGNRGRGSSRGS